MGVGGGPLRRRLPWRSTKEMKTPFTFGIRKKKELPALFQTSITGLGASVVQNISKSEYLRVKTLYDASANSLGLMAWPEVKQLATSLGLKPDNIMMNAFKKMDADGNGALDLAAVIQVSGSMRVW